MARKKSARKKSARKSVGKVTAQKSGDRRGKSAGARATQFKPGNPWRIKPGEIKNPGGRPRLLSDSYRDWLKLEDEHGITNADKVAQSMGIQAINGEVPAAREMRQTTEGDKLTFDITKLSDEQLDRLASGEDIRSVLANPGVGRAGTAAPEEPGDAND